MYITISDIEHALYHSPGHAEVRCKVGAVGGYYTVHLHITADTVTVAGVARLRDAPGVDVARILIAPDLIDATRRLFGLGGAA